MSTGTAGSTLPQRDVKEALARLLLQRSTPGTPTPAGPTDEVTTTALQTRVIRRGLADPITANGSRAFRLHGPLDRDRLTNAVDQVVARNATLRTAIDPTGDPSLGFPMRLLDRSPVSLEYSDTKGQEPEKVIAAVVQEEAARVFDLASGRTHAFRLVCLGDDDHLLVCSAHLAVFDGWSSSLLLRQLSTAYRGDELPRSAEIGLRDFAHWQRNWVDGLGADEVAAATRALPDGPEPAPFPGRRYVRRISVGVETTRRVRALAEEHRTTPFMVFLTALSQVIRDSGDSRLGDGTTVCVGVPVSGRFCSSITESIGQFTSVVPIVLELPVGSTFIDILSNAGQILLRLVDGERIPVDALCRAGQPYGVLFSVNDYPTVSLDFTDVSPTDIVGPVAHHLHLYSPCPSQTALNLGLTDQTDRFAGTVEFQEGLIDEAAAMQIVDALVLLLDGSTALSQPKRPRS